MRLDLIPIITYHYIMILARFCAIYNIAKMLVLASLKEAPTQQERRSFVRTLKSLHVWANMSVNVTRCVVDDVCKIQIRLHQCWWAANTCKKITPVFLSTACLFVCLFVCYKALGPQDARARCQWRDVRALRTSADDHGMSETWPWLGCTPIPMISVK